MNWKSDTRLADLDPAQEIEATCLRCGLVRTRAAGDLQQERHWRYAYLDEVERDLHCAHRTCGGRVRLALIYDRLTEGFVGGMP